MKMPSYLESRAKAYGRLEKQEVVPETMNCTLGWSITVEAVMPSAEITMKMKPEVVIKRQLAIQADMFLVAIGKSLEPKTGGQMIMREQEAAGVCFLCAKRRHISVNCPGLKLGGL
jgi:hypothetical protein